MSDRNFRDAKTGEWVTEEYAAANPDTTVSEEIEEPSYPPLSAVNDGYGDDVPIEFSESDLADLKELGVTGGDAPTFHTILEVWREVLAPAYDQLSVKVTPQWASKMVQSYPELKFADCTALQESYFGKLIDLLDIIKAEIATDDECLTYSTPEEDVENNSGHYLEVLTQWQLTFLGWELAWSCEDEDAAVELAAISETHKAIFGDLGMTQFLDNIKFEFTDADSAALAEKLQALRNGEVEGE
jgi:hypothetical protein